MQPIPYWRLSGFYFFHFAFIGAFAPYWSLYLKSLSFGAFQIGVLMSLLHVTRIFCSGRLGVACRSHRQAVADCTIRRNYRIDKLLRGFFWPIVYMAIRNHGPDEFLLERIFAFDRGNHAFLSW